MAGPEKEHDDITGTATTQHEWDGIKELDTPLPRWWLWTFYATIVWGVGYTIAYPAWPMITEATGGILGYSSRAEVAEAIEAHQAANADIRERLVAASFEEIAADEALANYARSGGAAVFRAHCSQCHGAGAAGGVGYPNLQDDAWIWGGTPDAIYATVAHGIRWEENDDTRFSQMPAFGEILEDTEIEALAGHVLSLSGQATGSEEGATLYEENCAACHGEDGGGMYELGAPRLSDAIWLYGGDMATVIETITYSRAGVMPAWETRLSEAEIRQVAYYVHSLGGGE